METIASDSRRTFFLRPLSPGAGLGVPFDGAPYPALLWATARTSPAQKARLCAALVASGCRYLVCGGRDSEAWEDAADEAFVAQDLSDEDLRERHVMTTSFPGFPADEVVPFFVHDTSFGEHGFTRYLVVLIGDDRSARERLVAAVREELSDTES